MKKRLFISTGFYSTLLAATIAESSCFPFYENHLLITLDRQSAEHNRLWAYRLNANWATVDTTDHTDYYVGDIKFKYNIVEFDEVISPFPSMHGAVAQAFPAKKYKYYEEGLTSYKQCLDRHYNDDDIFYSLHPHIFNDNENLLSVPINAQCVLKMLEIASQCYITPTLSGKNNVILIGTGGFPEEEKNAAMQDEFLSVIADLSSKGYKIILLDHTRVPVDENTFNIIKSNPRFNVIKISITSPLSDLFLLHNKDNIKFIVGIYSTLLLNSKLLFDIPSYSLNCDFLGERQLSLANIQNSVIPPYK
jgi:hypothetical protein